MFIMRHGCDDPFGVNHCLFKDDMVRRQGIDYKEVDLILIVLPSFLHDHAETV